MCQGLVQHSLSQSSEAPEIRTAKRYVLGKRTLKAQHSIAHELSSRSCRQCLDTGLGQPRKQLRLTESRRAVSHGNTGNKEE
eukprot:4786803-Amphidinium_carterae.1